MVAMVVSSLLIGLILSIFTRMSMAYRAQQNISELQQTLAAAQELIQRDLRQAGYALPDGFRWAGAGANTTVQPLEIVNNADFGPDLVRIYYADASAQARVQFPQTSNDPAVQFTTITVDDIDRFVVGDLAALVTTERDAANQVLPSSGAVWYHQHACAVRIRSIAGNLITIENAAPWGSADNDHCDDARSRLGLDEGMLYRFRARAYRIDPARRNLAVLQMSPTGTLVPNDWQDLGVGFTDLQVASRWNDAFADQPPPPASSPDDQDTADLDTDPLSEWYSGELQEALTAPIVLTTDAALYHRPVPAEVRLSLVVRTLKNVDAIPTAATPRLTDPARVDNNDLGDRAAITLAGVPDAARPAELRGDAVFRHATIGADLRNLAVGQ
jgi:type II secretory pathway pseudopilin PulG